MAGILAEDSLPGSSVDRGRTCPVRLRVTRVACHMLQEGGDAAQHDAIGKLGDPSPPVRPGACPARIPRAAGPLICDVR